MKYPCEICNKSVHKNHRAIQCDICQYWIHIKCNGVSLNDYHDLQLSDDQWFCKKCISDIFPFSSLYDTELNNLLNCRKPSDLDLLPSLDILSKLSGLPNLDNYDIEDNLPNPINSKYYYPTDFDNLVLQASTTNETTTSLFERGLVRGRRPRRET